MTRAALIFAVAIVLIVVRFSTAQSANPTATATASGAKLPFALPSQPSPRSLSTPCQPLVDVCELLNRYAALTHLKIIRDNFVQGKVSIDDTAGLPAERAIEVIERTLFADGFAITQ